MATILASDEMFVVATPDYSTLGTTIKAINHARRMGTKISGLILNRVYDQNFEISLKDIEKTLDVPIMAIIPHDVEVLRAQSHFIPVTSHKPNSEGSIEFKKLAAALIGEKYQPSRFRRFMRITPSKSDINRELFYKRVFE